MDFKNYWIWRNRYTIFIALLGLALCFMFYRCGRESVKPDKVIEYRDSIKVIEGKVKVVEKEVIKYKDKVKYLKEVTEKIVYDTTACKEIVAYKDSIIATQDTIIVKQDTVIYLEKEVIKWQDKIIETSPKPKRWGVGVFGGVDILGKPTIGAGVTYDLFQF